MRKFLVFSLFTLALNAKAESIDLMSSDIEQLTEKIARLATGQNTVVHTSTTLFRCRSFDMSRLPGALCERLVPKEDTAAADSVVRMVPAGFKVTSQDLALIPKRLPMATGQSVAIRLSFTEAQCRVNTHAELPGYKCTLTELRTRR